MHKKLMAAVALCALLAGPGAAQAASISLNLEYDSIDIAGTLVFSDVDVFRQMADSVDTANTHYHVTLNSPGGSVLAGIGIGKIIREKGFSTVVLEETRCTSACALAWLGGTKRIISRHGGVGFHGAFDGTTKQASSWGNALVGAYLERLGLSDQAIIYATDKPFNELRWLDYNQAKKLGIAADVIDCNVVVDRCLFTATDTGKVVAASSRKDGK